MADIALKINGRQVTVPEGYTILEAAETVGIEIPDCVTSRTFTSSAPAAFAT